MSREQFIDAARRVRAYATLAYFLAACAAVGLGFLLAWWASLVHPGEWLRAHLHEAAITMIGCLVGVSVCGSLMLIPGLWADRCFGLRCPGCKRSLTLWCRHDAVLRSGLCCRCRQPLFEPDDGTRRPSG
jgi:hypothetical protein